KTMIRSFKSREAEMIFSRRKSARIPEEVQRLALRELRALDRAPLCREVWAPSGENSGNGSGGGAHGRYAIAINDEWQIRFDWREGHAYDVEIVDGAPHHKE
ncbi:MAG TPA: hypothetical protein VGA73_11915, partial [Candidatus Binatia bacterium]